MITLYFIHWHMLFSCFIPLSWLIMHCVVWEVVSDPYLNEIVSFLNSDSILSAFCNITSFMRVLLSIGRKQKVDYQVTNL